MPDSRVVPLSGGAEFEPKYANSGPVSFETNGDTLTDATNVELTRLAAQRIVVVGGTAAIRDAVAEVLAAYTAGDVERLAGVDRYATAAAVAGSFAAGSPVFVATGEAPWDVLASAPAASAADAALLLVRPGAVPQATAVALDALAPQAITILGGTAAVSLPTELEVAAHIR